MYPILPNEILEELEYLRKDRNSAWEGCVKNQPNDLLIYLTPNGEVAIAPLRFVAYVRKPDSDRGKRCSETGLELLKITESLSELGYSRMNPKDRDSKLFDTVFKPYFESLKGGGSAKITKCKKQFETNSMSWWLPIIIDIPEAISPEQFAKEQHIYKEGTTVQITRNIRERDPKARAKCVAHYSRLGRIKCLACELDFVDRYNEIGRRFIHIHHLDPIAEAKGCRLVTPEIDLVPVCPNCHSIIHRRKPMLSIREVRHLLKLFS